MGQYNLPETVVDNDIVEKLCRWNSVSGLSECLKTEVCSIGDLGSLRFVVGKKLNRVGLSAASEQLDQFLQAATSETAFNRNGKRFLTIRVAQPFHDANAWVQAQRVRDCVGVKQESEGSKPDLASRRSVPHAREYLVGVQVEFSKVDSRLELPICLGKTAPTGSKLLKFLMAHQHRDRFAASGQLHRFAARCFSDQSRQVAAGFRD